MESEHLLFVWIKNKPKTKVWEVQSLTDKSKLGIIEWYPHWRQYCFFPEPNCVWSQDCLEDLIRFLKRLKEDRKIKE